MTTENKNIFRRVTDKVYGGLPMGWPVVILYAVGTALLTTAFLLIPIFENTSFYRVGVTLEAWVFFAVIIMANCKKPLESALKTFVFFLISHGVCSCITATGLCGRCSPFPWRLSAGTSKSATGSAC